MPLGTIKATRPFEKISWDIIGSLPTSSKGKKYILVVTDIFSKWVAFQTTDTETLATVLVNEIICQYDIPPSLQSDQGANLTSQVISFLCRSLGIECTETPTYHPKWN